MKNLGTTGITWCHPVSNQVITSLLFPLVCPCDAVARCMLQGITQFNGKFGCSWCLHKGEVVEKGKGTMRAFRYMDFLPRRTYQQVIESAACAVEEGGVVQGVKTASPLLELKDIHFDIVEGFSVDYMHCVLLGCVRQLMNLWFSSKHHRQTWYLGRVTTQIDKMLTGIKPPHDISRLPRSTSELAYWKASEFKNWLFYYSVPILSEVMPKRFFEHYCLLVAAVEKLCKSGIGERDLMTANELLSQFIRKMQHLYGIEEMTYNIHQLNHLVDSVATSGPLWATSAFPYESHNQFFLKLFHGTSNISSQICESFLLFKDIPTLASHNYTCLNSPKTENFVQDLLRGYPLAKRAVLDNSGCMALGKPTRRVLNEREYRLLTQIHGHCEHALNAEQMHEFYSRAVIGNKRFTTKHYDGSFKRVSSYVQSTAGQIGRISSIVLLDCPHKLMFLILELFEQVAFQDWLPPRKGTVPITHIVAVETADSHTVISPLDVKFKCVNVHTGHQEFCCIQPNMHEID